jgi:hypothetical protein
MRPASDFAPTMLAGAHHSAWVFATSGTWTPLGSVAAVVAVIASGITVYYARSTVREARAARHDDRQDRRRVRLERVAELLANMQEIATGPEGTWREERLRPYTTLRVQLHAALRVLELLDCDLPQSGVIADYQIGFPGLEHFNNAFAELQQAFRPEE